MKVSEVMTTEFETIDKDQKLIDAINLMRKKDVTRLITMQDDKVVGIISFRDVADRLGSHKTEGISPKSMHVSSAMSYPIITIESSMDVVDAAKLMVDKRISSLIVMDADELKGLLRKFDLLKVIEGCKRTKVRDLMTENVIQVTESERVIAARNTMLEKKFSILPVMNGPNIVGIVDDETIADALAKFRERVPVKHQKSRIHEFYIGNVMKLEPPIINDKSALCDVIDVFRKSLSKGIFVQDKSEKLVGLLTLTDITDAIAKGKI